ncbi:acetylornithine transaminase [Pycnococcus provasolii]
MLQTRTHAFRRGGITYLRDRLREKGAHHFDMLHTLLSTDAGSQR